MQDARQVEIDRNYDFFQRNLAMLIPDHLGQFALLKDGRIVEFYDGPGKAYRSGLDKFGDQPFSIQEVDDRPAEMGLISIALD